MTISEVSIRNHVFAWMLMAAMLIFGGVCFSRMGISQLPDVDFPIVSVNLTYEGAAPEVMELDVVDPIESAITSVQGIRSMTSTSRTGTASVTVEFGLDKDIDVAVQEIQAAIGRVQRQLPDDMDPAVIRKSNPDDQPVLWLAVTAEGLSSKDLMTLVRDQIQDHFTTVDGVADILLGGYNEPNLRVWLNPQGLNRYQMTATDVIGAIQREHSEMPGGRVETSTNEINIRTLGEAPTVQDFGELSVSRRGGTLNYLPIPLKALARVEEGTADVRSVSRSSGKTAVGLGIRKQAGSNAVQVARDVKKRLAEIAPLLPKGVEVAVRNDSSHFIEEAVGELNFTLILSALLTAAVCWLFLGSWSATVNVILAIPTSVVGSFIALYALGFTLNTFTLLGLSLAIGIVVDDAIMVLENIVRHMEMKKTRRQAALDGSREITLAALAATAAIIAIFLPVAFMEGLIGKYFLQFGVTLSVAVAISLLEALTLTPMRCSRFLKIAPRTTLIGRSVEKAFEGAAHIYARLIPITVDHPWKTITVALIFFLSTSYIGTRLNREFVPAEDQGRLLIRVQTEVGSSLTYTDGEMKKLEAYVASLPEVAAYFSSIGGGGGNAAVNTGTIFLNLKERKDRKRSAQELMVFLRKNLREITKAKVNIQDPSLSGLGARRGYPIEFSVRGTDWDKLVDSTQKIMDEMEKTHLMTDIDTNYQAGMPEIQVIPDRPKARERGVDVNTISETVNTMMAGTIAGKYTSNGRRFDVRVSLPASDRVSQQAIESILLRNDRGELVPLKDVVTLKEHESLQQISREDRQRSISVYANVAPGVSQAKAIQMTQDISKQVLPAGYYATISGSAKTFQESSQGLILALMLGIIVSYMVLASQFNSFVHPITILIALPFSVSGAFIALFLGGQTLNLYSMIGLILLMGIVKKNSILLVEFTNHVKDQGRTAREALIEACPIRLRPILMTSIATIAGAIPPALAIGPGAETRVPMALSLIGGVIVSTMLTLFVVPSTYILFDRLSGRSLIHTDDEEGLQNQVDAAG